ncbi:hypothetical protein EV175_004634 [Coemansia sp. RSA 1933]|nr:hypothetical protein EV175_004634 [Coemansia sp. RSA 1933]
MWRIPLTNGLRVPMLGLLALWMVFLAILGFTRLITVPASDKALHFIGFGIMAVLVFFSFQATVPRRKAWVLTGASMTVVCFFSEVLQWLLTTRAFEWSDIVCNFLGASMFLFTAWMADRWIIQPRIDAAAGLGSQYQDSTRYWVLDGRGDDRSPRESIGDDLDVELDDILVDSPQQTARDVPSPPPPGH